MASKLIKSQFKKALQLIKEGWPVNQAIEATYTSLVDEIGFEEYEEMVEKEVCELGGTQYVTD